MDIPIQPYPHRCLTCGMDFSDLSMLSFHCSTWQGHVPNPFYCVLCGLSFVDNLTMVMHSLSNEHRLVIEMKALGMSQRWQFITHASNQLSGQYIGAQQLSQPDIGSRLDGKGISNHGVNVKSEDRSFSSHTCPKCLRVFKSALRLLKHEHAPLSHVMPTIPCPHKECDCKFKAVSCVAHHMEAGRHGHTRHDVTDIVHKLDKDGIISINRRISDSTTNGNKETYTYSATEETFNDKGYECPLCDRVCKTLNGLNTHLNSAAHDQMEFRCWKCERLFKLVSALAQHLEACMCDTATARRVDSHISSLSATGAVTVGSRTASHENRPVSTATTTGQIENHIARLTSKHPLSKSKKRKAAGAAGTSKQTFRGADGPSM